MTSPEPRAETAQQPLSRAGVPADLEAADELATELATERTLHQRTIAELDTMRVVAQGNKRHVGDLTEENERLRARIHEAVDECQRRHATYVSRCASFEKWSAWARSRFEEQGSRYWSMTSEANRLVIMSIIAERDDALAEVARVRAAVVEDLTDRLSDLREGWIQQNQGTTGDIADAVGCALFDALGILREYADAPADPAREATTPPSGTPGRAEPLEKR